MLQDAPEDWPHNGLRHSFASYHLAHTDLKEIKINVGRGLVNDDNFRDDITVDGKVNHGDTTLEKSKL